MLFLSPAFTEVVGVPMTVLPSSRVSGFSPAPYVIGGSPGSDVRNRDGSIHREKDNNGPIEPTSSNEGGHRHHQIHLPSGRKRERNSQCQSP